MGTNYYLEPVAPCGECKRPFERKHIGKSSGGWCFSLHTIPGEGIHDLHDWVSLWDKDGARIVNEYDEVIPPYEMLKIVSLRRGHKRTDAPVRGPGSGFDYERNHAEPGPEGLIRAHIDGQHCVGHGAGTWDLMVGEYS